MVLQKNGICFLVADKREISDARDHLTIALNTPLELFAEVSTLILFFISKAMLLPFLATF